MMQTEVKPTVSALDPAKLRTQMDRGDRFQVIDVRSAQEFATGHIPGAVNVPMDELDTRLADLSDHSPVVLVCQSGTRAGMCAEKLKQTRRDVNLLTGGTSAWVAAGLPVVRTAASSLPLVRQVHVTIGPLILLGSVLAIVGNPLWAILALLMGAGLTIAGATGWCGMALLLAKMPWNATKPKDGDSPTTCCN